MEVGENDNQEKKWKSGNKYIERRKITEEL
jgi:hypothetical protein